MPPTPLDVAGMPDPESESESEIESPPPHAGHVVIMEGDGIELRANYEYGLLVSVDGIIYGKPSPKQSLRYKLLKSGMKVNRYVPEIVKIQKLRKALDKLCVDNGCKKPHLPMFGSSDAVHVTMTFHLERTNCDFKNKDNRLLGFCARARSQWFVKKPDIDNLAKFYFDALSEVIYLDDVQIMSAHLTKKLDNEDECFGRTSFRVELLERRAGLSY
jgi:hypothetical protein